MRSPIILVPRLRLGTRLLRAKLCCALLVAGFAHAAEPPVPMVTFRGAAYILREVDPRKEDLQVFLKSMSNVYLHDFGGLQTYVESRGEKLLWAANAGMFQPDSAPCGLLVEDGTEIAPLNLNDGPGNFYMKPNGVFLINQKHEALVVASDEYATLLTPALWATQSGPLLVHGGDIHPDFNAESKSLKTRSGVGVRKDGTAVFALSRQPVNFYTFAALFRDKLQCPNALYLDGDISAFYTPGVKDAAVHSFGPMVGVVAKTAP